MVNIVIKAGLGFFSFIYALMRLFPVRKKVVFLSRQSDEPSDDISMLDREFRRRGWTSVVMCRKIGSGLGGKARYILHMFRQCYQIATAKILILDSYCILASCLKKRKDLLIIQMWHSVGTMKKAGLSILDQKEGTSSSLAKAMHMHENYDYALCAGEGYRSHMAMLFGMPEDRVEILPLPRVELLKDEKYAEEKAAFVKKAIPEIANGKINVLYAPTFRKDPEEEKAHQKAIDELISAFDFDKYNLIVSLHPLSKIEVNDSRCIVPHGLSSFDMIFVSDIMVSDYSCVVYEAAVRDIPLYFYAFDYDEYTKDRGFYINYLEEMPGPVCRTAEELTGSLEKPYDMDRLISFRDRYISPESHDETKAIVDFAESHVK
ncbi:MAG: CDP-glycerol glycerophosphotransferase family protein [Anaerovoracaceae bacterium]